MEEDNGVIVEKDDGSIGMSAAASLEAAEQAPIGPGAGGETATGTEQQGDWTQVDEEVSLRRPKPQLDSDPTGKTFIREIANVGTEAQAAIGASGVCRAGGKEYKHVRVVRAGDGYAVGGYLGEPVASRVEGADGFRR